MQQLSQTLSTQNIKWKGFVPPPSALRGAIPDSDASTLSGSAGLSFTLPGCLRQEGAHVAHEEALPETRWEDKDNTPVIFLCMADGRHRWFNGNCLFSNISPGSGLFPASLSEMEQQDQDGNAPEEVMAINRATPPCLLICYSSNDGPAHVKAVVQLGAFIQKHMATQVQWMGLLRFAAGFCEINRLQFCFPLQVFLDLWDSLSVAQEGSMVWHCQKIRESDFILVVCSQGLNRRKAAPGTEKFKEEEADAGLNCASDTAVQVISEEVGRAKARGQDLSKYIAAIFEYCDETDIPTELRLVSNYTLPNDLVLLFSHLHGMTLYRPGSYLKVNHISAEGFTELPAGAALQQAICEAGMAMTAKKHPSLDGED